MKWNIKNYAAICVIFLTSCEGYSTAEGIVKDKATGIALDSVLCKVITAENIEAYTDSLGKFNVKNNWGSCIGGCRDIKVEFSKKGYRRVIKTQESANGVIYLEK